jgi:hypothetical protein
MSEVRVRNNICVSRPDSRGKSIIVDWHDPGYHTEGVIENNLVVGGERGIDCLGVPIAIRNNIIVGTQLRDLYYMKPTDSTVGFNLFWGVHNSGHPADTASRPARGSMFADPMFVDTNDYHLQAFSPAIDAGDTLLLDPDGSRSDIGPYGGPLGEVYAYLDLPPKTPTGLSGSPSDTAIALTWHGNYEADLDNYELYRTDLANPALLLATPTDSAFTDTTVTSGLFYEYQLRALDQQGNASGMSDEVEFVAAGISDDDPMLPQSHQLHPVYPNPFNASTTIRYSLATPSAVRLFVYSILGQRVRVLVDQTLPAGEHSARWDGRDHAGREAGSGIYFIVMKADNQQVVRKAMLLK